MTGFCIHARERPGRRIGSTRRSSGVRNDRTWVVCDQMVTREWFSRTLQVFSARVGRILSTN